MDSSSAFNLAGFGAPNVRRTRFTDGFTFFGDLIDLDEPLLDVFCLFGAGWRWSSSSSSSSSSSVRRAERLNGCFREASLFRGGVRCCDRKTMDESLPLPSSSSSSSLEMDSAYEMVGFARVRGARAGWALAVAR